MIDRAFGKHIRWINTPDEYGNWVALYSIMAGWPKVEEWCVEHSGVPVHHFWDDTTGILSGAVRFRNQEDLTIFLLRWL